MPALADYANTLAADLETLAYRARQLAAALNDADWKPTTSARDRVDGTPIDRHDMEGEPLHVGDRVKVVDSERYGEPTGIVRGPGPNLGDGKQRVHIELDDGQDPVYTPSVGRVRRLGE